MDSNENEMRAEFNNRKLARAYVALAYARDVASSYIAEKPAHAELHPLLTMLDMTNGLLEELLEHSMPMVPPAESETETSSDLVM
ncbi:MAG TPA: hypothetical protein VL866_06000 [Pyrinomonadaceae bacterium]|nr:hypothetical protein [Pyrinomonadaceae bacterium]